MLNPIVKGKYNEASNPIFEVFYLVDAKAEGLRYVVQNVHKNKLIYL